MKNLLLVLGTLLAGNLCGASFSIDFTATNLGGSTYRYDYLVSGGPLSEDPAYIDIVFPFSLFENLTNATPGFPATDVLPPIPAFSSNGSFILYLNSATVYTNQPFAIEVDLIAGQSLPPSQQFFVYSGTVFDADLQFDLPVLVQEGETKARVVVDPEPPTGEIPEPSTTLLLSLGLGALLLRRRQN